MKHLFLLLLLTTITACDDDDAAAACAHTSQGDQITLADGTLARIAIVSGSRCPCVIDCLWNISIGMTITIGNDTILKVEDGSTPDSTSTNPLYITSRGDRIRLINYTEPYHDCSDGVVGEELCLELAVE